jgi:hypothetical protein
MEDAREREIALPLQLLTQLVRASDKATHDFLTWYLNNTLDLYKKTQETIHTRLSHAKDAVTSPLEFVLNLLARPFSADTSAGRKHGKYKGNASASPAGERAAGSAGKRASKTRRRPVKRKRGAR